MLHFAKLPYAKHTEWHVGSGIDNRIRRAVDDLIDYFVIEVAALANDVSILWW